MLTAFQVLRVVCALVALAAVVLLFADLSGSTTYNDARLARAFSDDRAASTEGTRQELAVATGAHHDKRVMVTTVEMLLLVVFGTAVFFTTRAIHAQII